MENKTVVYPILYSIDNKDKIRQWQAIVNPIGHKAEIIITHGLLDGKKTSKTREVTKGKNIGKINQTTPFTQALLDADSLLRKQKDKSYYSLKDLKITHENGHYFDENGIEGGLVSLLKKYLPKESTSASGFLKPMKYQKYRLPEYKIGTKEYETSREMLFPLYASPKKDGICSVGDRTTGLSSRGGKESLVKGGETLNNLLPHIVKALKVLNYSYPLNGELYVHGYKLEDIKDACTKKNDLSAKIEFHIFDIIDLQNSYKSRRKMMFELATLIKDLMLDDYLKVVQSEIIFNIDELLDYEEKQLDNDFEGVMVANAKGMYKLDYRTPDKLKLVRMDSMELVVKDIVPYDNEPTQGKFVCTYQPDHEYYQNGVEFYVDGGFGFDVALKEKLLRNKEQYIGKLLTIVHRGFTVHNLPRIPKGEGGAKAFRELGDL